MWWKSWFGGNLMIFEANLDFHHVRKVRAKIEFFSKLSRNNIWVLLKCLDTSNMSGTFLIPHTALTNIVVAPIFSILHTCANLDFHHLRKVGPKIKLFSKLSRNNIWVVQKCYAPLHKSRSVCNVTHRPHEHRVLPHFTHFSCKSWFSRCPKSWTKNQTFFKTL